MTKKHLLKHEKSILSHIYCHWRKHFLKFNIDVVIMFVQVKLKHI